MLGETEGRQIFSQHRVYIFYTYFLHIFVNFSANKSVALVFIDNHTKCKLIQRFLEDNIGKTMRRYYLHLPKILLTRVLNSINTQNTRLQQMCSTLTIDHLNVIISGLRAETL